MNAIQSGSFDAAYLVDLMSISAENSDKLDQLCVYVREYFGVSHVLYSAVLPNDQYVILSTHLEFLKKYLSAGLHTHCPFLHSEEVRSVPAVHMPFIEVPHSLTEYKALCDAHALYNPITFAHTSAELQETLTLFHTDSNLQVINLYLNSINKLQGYFSSFKKDVATLMSTYSATLPAASMVFQGPKEASIFLENKPYLKISDSINNSIEKLIDIIPSLSFREAQILQFYLEYRSAKEIARYTGLSARTVEKHIENFKKKIGSHKKEVILKTVKNMLQNALSM